MGEEMINNKKVKALEARVKELEEQLKTIQEKEQHDREQAAIQRISRPTIDLGTHNLTLTKACGKLRIMCDEKPKDCDYGKMTFTLPNYYRTPGYYRTIERVELPWIAIVELKKILNNEVIG
jgi:hypothetical protein